jgi:mitogen-activated protein kinase kinase
MSQLNYPYLGLVANSFMIYSLEKMPNRRASPWKMLEHPWMVEMRPKRVNMVKYLAFVWGWDEKDVNSSR